MSENFRLASNREKLPMEMWHVRSNTEDDGLSWSKYEQKEILGAKFPRSVGGVGNNDST